MDFRGHRAEGDALSWKVFPLAVLMVFILGFPPRASAQDTFGVGSANGNAVTAGMGFTFAVTVLSPCCPAVLSTGYGDPVTFASNDPLAVLPPATSTGILSSGTANFSATLFRASPPANTAITVVDPADINILGHGLFTVVPGPVSQFGFSIPASAVQGALFSFGVTAVDGYGNVITSYTGPVAFTSSDPLASFAVSSWTSGVGNGTGVFNTAGSQTIHIMDTSSSASSTSGPINVITPTATATPSVTPSSTPTATATATPLQPILTSLNPNNGPTQGGTTIVLTGGNLSGTASAAIGPNSAAVLGNSANAITIVSPVGSGAGQPVVVTINSQVSNALSFSYDPPTLTNLSPSSGPSTGGISVTLTGTNFTTLGLVVTVGSTTATVFSVSSTQIVFIEPAGSGTLPVVASVSGQASNSLPFTFVAPTPTNTPSATPSATPLPTSTPTVTRTPVVVVIPPTVTPTPNAALYLDQNFFNPNQQSLGMDVRVDQPGEVKLEVFNIAGDVVRKIADLAENTGNYRFAWDGHNDAGAIVGNSVYFIVIQTPSGNMTRKVIVLK